MDQQDTSLTNWLYVGSIMLFIVSFAVGFGPTVWVYLSEIYPKELRASCLSVGIVFNWAAVGAVVFGLGTLFDSFTDNEVSNLVRYAVLSFLNISALLFVKIVIVETKGTSMENCPVYEGRRRRLAEQGRGDARDLPLLPSPDR